MTFQSIGEDIMHIYSSDPAVAKAPPTNYDETLLKKAVDDLENRLIKNSEASLKASALAQRWSVVAAISAIVSAVFAVLAFFLR